MDSLNEKCGKDRINLTASKRLLEEARAAGLNISRLLDVALAAELYRIKNAVDECVKRKHNNQCYFCKALIGFDNLVAICSPDNFNEYVADVLSCRPCVLKHQKEIGESYVIVTAPQLLSRRTSHLADHQQTFMSFSLTRDEIGMLDDFPLPDFVGEDDLVWNLEEQKREDCPAVREWFKKPAEPTEQDGAVKQQQEGVVKDVS